MLSRDNLKISFRVHTVWRMDEGQVPLFMERYKTTVMGNHQTDRAPDSIVEVAYGSFVKEPLRTFARIEIERKERTKREKQAQGIANAMKIIRGQLSPMYIRHEAIEAQKQMVNSPNHTVVYIPVGPMGVPIAATMPAVPQVAEAATK